MNSGTELVALLCKHEHLFLSLVSIYYCSKLYSHFFMPITFDVCEEAQKERIYTLNGLINGKGG